MITFDQNGHVTPYEIIQTDYETFVSHFITNEHRVNIFEDYKRLIEGLNQLDLTPFYQWINGSFVSRHPRPNDIDVVTFVYFQAYERYEQELRALKGTLNSVDCYFVKDYPENHANHFITRFDKIEWTHLFSTDRRRRRKGFIQLNF